MPIPTADLQLDLDADTIVSSDGTAVTTWSDQSGNGNDVTQGTAANRPVYNTTRVNLNSKPTVTFDNSNDSLTNTGGALAFSGNTGLTIYAVVEETTVGSSNPCGIIGRDASGNRGWLLSIEDNSNTGRAAFLVASSASARTRRDGNKVDCRLLPCLIVARYDGSASEQSIWVNGILDNGSIDAAVPATIGNNGANLQVGNDGFSEPFGGRIARILVYDVAHSDATRQEIEAELMTEYDLSGFTESGPGPDVNSHQGYTTDETYHYTADTSRLDKRNDDGTWSVVTQNSSPFSGLSGAIDHCGDPCYHNGRLYVPIEQYTNCSSESAQHIAVYLTSTLARESATDISAQNHEASSIAIDAQSNILYVSDYCSSMTIYKYNLDTLTYIGPLALVSETTIGGVQGISFRNGKLWMVTGDNVASAGSGLVIECNPNTGVCKPIWHVTRHSGTLIPEGIHVVEGALKWIFDEGSNERVYTYTSERFESPDGTTFLYAPRKKRFPYWHVLVRDFIKR